MKKTMMMMATALFAVVSVQAVALNWTGNGTTAKIYGLTSGTIMTTGAGSQTAGMTAYYLLSSDLVTVQSKTAESDILALAKATASGQTATSTGAAGRMGGSTTVSASTAGVSYFVRVYATFSGADYYMDLKDANSAYWTTTKTGDDTVTESLAWSAATYGGATGVSGDFNKWVAVVPEPTSMALLAMGVVALGLRRKFRA